MSVTAAASGAELCVLCQERASSPGLVTCTACAAVPVQNQRERYVTATAAASAAAGGRGCGGGGNSVTHEPFDDSREPFPSSSDNRYEQCSEDSDNDQERQQQRESEQTVLRDPKLDEKVNKRLEDVESSWQVVISSIKAGKQAVAEGNEDPTLTKWSKKYLPEVLDAVMKLQEHVVDTEHFELIFNKLYDIIEVAVQGRPPKANDDFLSNFRECNELILTVLTAFVSLRGGLYFKEDQFKDQYGNAPTQFENQLIAVNDLLLDCSPTPYNDNWDNEQDAAVPADSKAKNWKEYVKTMIALKDEQFVRLQQEVIFWSQKLKAVINYIDPCKSKEEKKILQLNNVKLNDKNKNNNNNNNNRNVTSVEAIRQDLASFYNDVEFSMSQSSSSSSGGESGEQEGEGEAAAGKFEDFFCNLRLKERQQQGVQQSITEGEFVSASHLPTRLRSAARTVLVTGPGGAGKTVALKHICIQQGVEDSVIVFVPLKELRGMSRRIKSIAELLKLSSAFAALSEEQVKAIVEKRIPVIFAFDGFDEVHNAQEGDKNIAHFLSDMIDPKKRKFSLENKKLTKLVRSCDRVIISSREERIASSNCNLDSPEARPLVDELAVQLWTNSEVERFCLRFFSNAFKKQEQEQQNQKGEDEQQLAKAVRTATNDVISSLDTPLMDSWRGLPLAVTLLSQLRSSSSSEYSSTVLDNMSPARAYSLVLEMHWRRSEMRVADRLLRCKKQYVLSCMNDHKIDLDRGVTRDGVIPELFQLVLNSAAEASFKQLLSTSSNVTEISFSSSSSPSSSSNNKLPLWAALLRETGLIRVENNNSKATFSHRSWIEFLCARHAATSTENAIDQIPWDQSKFASVWLLLADFARSGTFEKQLSVQRFSFAVMSKYRQKLHATFDTREGSGRRMFYNVDVDEENRKSSISLLARITNFIKPEDLFAPLHFVTPFRALRAAQDSLELLPNLVKRKSVSCSKCKTHFSEAPADWKCIKCKLLMWNPDTANCEICHKSFDFFNWRRHTRCCGKCVCSVCVFQRDEPDKLCTCCYFFDDDFCPKCVALAITPEMDRSASRHQEVNVVDEASLIEYDAQLTSSSPVVYSYSQKQTVAANSFMLHVRWLAELCITEGALRCFKFIEEKYPQALFGVFAKRNFDEYTNYERSDSYSEAAFKHVTSVCSGVSPAKIKRALLAAKKEFPQSADDLIMNEAINSLLDGAHDDGEQEGEEEDSYSFARSRIFSPALARALDHLDRPSVSACVDHIIDEHNVEVQLDDAIRLNSLVGVTRVINRMEKQDFSLNPSVQKDVKRGDRIMELFSDAIAKRHFDVVAAMLRSRRNQQGRFIWSHKVHHSLLLQLVFKYVFPQEFRVWVEEKKDFETSTLSDLAKLLKLDLSSNLPCEKFDVKLSEAEQHLWFQFFYLFDQVVVHGDVFSATPSPSPGQLRVLDLSNNKNFSDAGVTALVLKCSKLEVIDLSGKDTKFGDGSLYGIADLHVSSLALLRKLFLRSNKNFQDDSFSALVSKLRTLEELDVSETKLGDKSMRAIDNSQISATLQKMNLWGNTNVTDSGISALAKCTSLKEIILSSDPLNENDSSKLTDESLGFLSSSPSVKANRSLLKIDLSFNKNFTDGGMDHLKGGYGEFWCHVHVEVSGCDNIRKRH